MESSGREHACVTALLERMHDGVPEELRLTRRSLRGGLEAVGVARVAARYRDGRGRPRAFALIVKHLAGTAAREALVYEQLVAPHAADLAPRLLTSDRPVGGGAVLYLEALRPVRSWPWRETRAALGVLRQAARLHTTAPSDGAMALLAGWDYEAELQVNAERTLEQLDRARRLSGLPVFRAGVRWTRRLVAALPRMRRQLLEFGPPGRTAIHGDLHPGNAVVRRRRGTNEAVLIDWGRARIGSPLEDVSSWLQSLGAWEPEALRRHDTLFTGYLSARGLDRRLGSELRAAYWLAGASNALSGALLHHLTVMQDGRVSGGRRGSAARSARRWVRVLRRADAFWS